MWSPSEESPPRTLMLDARGRWVSALEDPLPDLWIDAAPFFAALSQSTSVASDEGREKLSTENLSSDVVSPWTILKSPDGERAPPLEYAQHILADNEAVRGCYNFSTVGSLHLLIPYSEMLGFSSLMCSPYLCAL
jgi:hypothetical protein